MDNETTTEQEEKDEGAQPRLKTYDKHCLNCETDYKAALETSKFCSQKCKSQWHRKNNKLGNINMKEDDDDTAPQQQTVKEKPSKEKNANSSLVSIVSGLPPQAQYIIAHQEKENKNLQKLYDDERTERKRLKEKYQTLKDKILEMETNSKIEAIQNEKPSGLQGFTDSPLFEHLMPHIGPAIGQLAQSFVTRMQGGGMSGVPVDGNLDGEVQSQIVEINKWYAGLPKPLQGTVYDMLTKFSQYNVEQLPNLITRINNLLHNGTALTNSGANAATGTY